MKQYPEYLEELIEFLKIPSISTLPAHKNDMRQAADWVAERVRMAGIETVELHTVDNGHPLVYAARIDDTANPTVLLYGHYDVQPVDPLGEWHSPPFSPLVKDGKIFARGASDDKGQFAAHLFALRELSKKWGDKKWPVNVKLIIEGEEEAGGVSIEKWASENPKKLAADFVLISDTAFIRQDVPSIDYGLRGIAYMELEVAGPVRDLHSGVYGGGIVNPLSALAHILDKLLDLDSGRVRIPGFYDSVVEITEKDRRYAAEVPFDKADFLARAGVKEDWGETGYTTYERITSRPSLDINGIYGGFQGEGAKTVLPRRAGAKISMRLVPEQEPDIILKQTTEYVKKIAPKGVDISCKPVYLAKGVLLDTESPYFEAAGIAMEEVFGRRPVFTRSGASIPVANVFNSILGLDIIFMGLGLPDDGLHSPNEKFETTQFYKGIEAVIKFLEKVGQMS